MNDLLIIKYFLDREHFLAYRHLVSKELVQGDTLVILALLDDWYATHESSISLEELSYLLLTRWERDKVSLLIQTLSDLPLSEPVLAYLEDLKRKQLLEQISLTSYEATTGKNVTHKLHDLFAKLGDVRVEEKEHFVDDGLEELLHNTFKEEGLRWRLKTLNRMLGSLRPGDFGFFVARPETGKTTLLASEVTHMAGQIPENKGPILWFNNEEQGRKVKLRVYQAALGVSLMDLLRNPQEADRKYQELTHGKIKIYDNASIQRKAVEAICNKYNPSLIIFDQLDKVQGFTSDRDDLRLGAIYQWARELAKIHECPVIGISQAPGEAEGVQWLTMNHIASSKTSKQAEADWIVGIGKLEDPSYNKVRYLSVMKNKLTGDRDTEESLRHGRLEVIIEAKIARYLDV